MTELKPCPFCGSENPRLYAHSPDQKTDWVVQCRFCYAAIPNWNTPEQAANARNMRAVPDIDEDKMVAEMLRAWTREMIRDIATLEVRNALSALGKEVM